MEEQASSSLFSRHDNMQARNWQLTPFQQRPAFSVSHFLPADRRRPAHEHLPVPLAQPGLHPPLGRPRNLRRRHRHYFGRAALDSRAPPRGIAFSDGAARRGRVASQYPFRPRRRCMGRPPPAPPNSRLVRHRASAAARLGASRCLVGRAHLSSTLACILRGRYTDRLLPDRGHLTAPRPSSKERAGRRQRQTIYQRRTYLNCRTRSGRKPCATPGCSQDHLHRRPFLSSVGACAPRPSRTGARPPIEWSWRQGRRKWRPAEFARPDASA